MVRGFFKESLETMTEHVAASAVPVNAARGVPVRKPRKQITFNQLVLKIHYIINCDNLDSNFEPFFFFFSNFETWDLLESACMHCHSKERSPTLHFSLSSHIMHFYLC